MHNQSLTIAILGFCLSSELARQAIAADAIAVPVVAKYSSPEEVFKAHRDACAKRDWRTVFECNTVKSQKLLIFEVCYHCMAAPEMSFLLKKFDADEERVTAEYSRRYEKKYGAAPPAGSPRLDVGLYAEVLWSQVKDPAALYVEWSKHIEAHDRYRPTSRLEDLKVKGDSATATAKVTVYVTREDELGNTTREEESVDELIPFRRTTTGGWLIDAVYE